MNNRRRYFSQTAKNAILFIILGALVCAAFFIMLRAWEMHRDRLNASDDTQYEDDDRSVIYLDGEKYRQRNHLETFLIIGLDKYDFQINDEETYSNDQQSDFLMLLIFDRDANTYVPLHINRDSMAPVQVLGVGGKKVETATMQLALSHTYGSGGADSCRNTVKAVSDFLYGVQIDHYLSFDRDAIAKINDLVGGVTVEIFDDFSKVDASLVKGQKICLNGEQAMSYVTARGNMKDSSNLARMERQRQYIRGFKEQALRCLSEDKNFSTRAFSELTNYLTSDCTINKLSNMVSETKNFEMAEIETVKGTAVKGKEFMEFYPDEQALKDLVVRLFFEPCDDE